MKADGAGERARWAARSAQILLTGSAPTPAPVPADAPKPANPEPTLSPIDPEKGRVKTPEPGKSEHPRQ